MLPPARNERPEGALMRIFPNGWCDEAAIRPSEHFNERPEGEEISLLVIHNISLPAGQFGTGDVDALFCGTLDCCKHPSYQDLEGLRVSSHFFIDRSGRLFQYVSCLDRAWHAGVSSYEAVRTAMTSRSAWNWKVQIQRPMSRRNMKRSGASPMHLPKLILSNTSRAIP